MSQVTIIDLTSETELGATEVIRPRRSPGHIINNISIKNKWTTEQRTWLFFVKRAYQNDIKDLASLFNHTFAAHLDSLGFQNNYPARSLDAQFREGPRWQLSEYRYIKSIPFSDLDRMHPMQQMVSEAAVQRGVHLVPRLEDDWLSSVYNKNNKRKRQRRSSLSSTDYTEDEPPSRPKNFLSTKTKRPKALSSWPVKPVGLLTPQQSFSSSLPSATTATSPSQSWRGRLASGNFAVTSGLPLDDGVPLIMFRAWNRSSYGLNAHNGFASGLFLNHPALPEDDIILLQYAENHIEFRPQPSPFVSCTNSFPTVLKKAFNMNIEGDAGGATNIAIILGNAAANATKLYHMHSIIQKLDRQMLSPRSRRYHGRFEFLAWQRVEGVVGQLSLDDFRTWAEEDRYLGVLFKEYDLSTRLSVTRFRQGFGESGLEIGRDLGQSIGSLASLFFSASTSTSTSTTGTDNIVIQNFVKTILQNLNITADLDAWQSNQPFCKTLNDSLQARPSSLSTARLSHDPARVMHDKKASTHRNLPIKPRQRRKARAWSTTTSLFNAAIEDVVGEESDSYLVSDLENDIANDGNNHSDLSDNDNNDNDDEDPETISIDYDLIEDAQPSTQPFLSLRLGTPVTPSLHRQMPLVQEPIMIQDSEDDTDCDDNMPSIEVQAASLLRSFTRPTTPPTKLISRMPLTPPATKQVATMPLTPITPEWRRTDTIAMLQSPYETPR